MFCVGRSHYLVLTGHAQALHLVWNRSDEFFALVDHELGHVANRDANLLELARALLGANLVGLALKVTAIFLIGALFPSARISEFYDGLVPQTSTLQTVGGFTQSWVTHKLAPTFSPPILLALVVAYSLALLSLFVLFYFIVVRRREFWADQFAVANAPNPANAWGALRRFLEVPAGRQLGTHSFRGGGLWHPSPKQRLRSLDEGEASVYGSYGGVVTFLTFCLLVSFRFTLGNSGMYGDYLDATETLQAISLFYIFVCGFCIACLVHPLSDFEGVSVYSSYVAFKQLIITSSAVSAALWIVQNFSGGFRGRFDALGDDERRAEEGYRSLMELESNEIGWMFLSIPLIVAAFALGYLLIRALIGFAGRGERVTIVSSSLGSLLAVTVLWALSLSGGADVEVGRRTNSAYVRSKYFMRRVQEDPTLIVKSGLNEIMLELKTAEVHRRIGSSRYAFHPPLSSLLLWHGPFRVGG